LFSIRVSVRVRVRVSVRFIVRFRHFQVQKSTDPHVCILPVAYYVSQTGGQIFQSSADEFSSDANS